MTKTKWDDGHGKDGLEGWRATVSGNTLVVYAEGSNHENDWKRNFRPWPRVSRQHPQWRKMAVWLVWEIARWAKESGATRIVLHGHSMGGAVVLIAADELVPMGYNVYVVTYGSPKPGIIRNTFPITQYRRSGDFVPLVPLMYRKPGKRIVFGKRLPVIKVWRQDGRWRITHPAHEPRSYYSKMEEEGIR